MKNIKNSSHFIPLKYNNPLYTLNILYSNLQATLTLPSDTPLKYNKSP